MKIVNVTFDPSIIIARFEYVIHFLNHHSYCIGKVFFQLDQEAGGDLHYGINPVKDGIFIPQQAYFFTEQYQFGKPLFVNSFEFENIIYYSIEEKSKALTKLVSGNQLNFDVFETIFFHLSRVEERMYPSELLKDSGLMPENELMVVKSGVQSQPIVDELLKALLAFLNIKINAPKLNKIITHDIDLVVKYQNSANVLHSLGSTVKRSYSLRKIAKFGKDFVLSKLGLIEEPYFDLRLLSTKDDIQKIIYLYVGGLHEFDFPRSEKRNKYIKKWATEAKAKGYMIGFHPSFEAATNSQLFAEELKTLEGLIEKKVTFSRQHYLHFNHKSTLKVLQANGIRHDSSFGFNRHIGFRTGTAYEYRLYDWENESVSDIIELPIAWMDSAIWHWSTKNAEIFKKESTSFFSRLIEGDICINIHNNTIYDFGMYDIDLLDLKSKFEEHG